MEYFVTNSLQTSFILNSYVKSLMNVGNRVANMKQKDSWSIRKLQSLANVLAIFAVGRNSHNGKRQQTKGSWVTNDN